MSLRFPWKTDDERGPKTDLRKSGPDLLQEAVNLVASRSSAHAFEDLIIDMLNGKIEVGQIFSSWAMSLRRPSVKYSGLDSCRAFDPTEPLHSDQTLEEFF